MANVRKKTGAAATKQKKTAKAKAGAKPKAGKARPVRATVKAKPKAPSKSRAAPKAKAKAKPAPKARPAAKARPATKVKVKAKAPAKAAAAPKAKAAPKARVAPKAKLAAAPKKPAPAAKPRPASAAPASAASPDSGRFIWHDLMTTDAEASRTFYTSLFGWQLDDVNMGGFTVHLIRVGDRRVGAIMQEQGIPTSHWVPYLGVDDVDEACARVTRLGGNVCISAMDVPKLGRFAVVNDPQGALFSPLRRPADAPTGEATPGPGAFVWDELYTIEPGDAAAFYRDFAGWTVDQLPESLSGEPYFLAKRGGRDIAGLTQRLDENARPQWIPYIAVADVDVSAKEALELGGRVTCEPTDIPNVGRFAIVEDPTGASFALFRTAHAHMA